MNTQKLKVIWICHFSDEKVRSRIRFCKPYFKGIFFKLIGRPIRPESDFAVWISNAVSEFEKFDDIELTVIFPHAAIQGKLQEFSICGVNYKCFRSEDDILIPYLFDGLFRKKRSFKRNRLLVKELIEQIAPDIVHVIGAENPYYSITALDVPRIIPLVVSLQTLLSDSKFLSNYPISSRKYNYRSDLEVKIIRKSNYIANPNQEYNNIIRQAIKPDAVFLNMPLALGQNIFSTKVQKEFDFVYFAANISKACDYAIEAFALVCKQYPKLVLNISGNYTQEYKSMIDCRIQELGIADNVIFTGPKSTHEEVLLQIKKSRFALIPLKIDLISGTIREAMACGLPVVTTITPATPLLNKNRLSVLLSEKGDFSAMANNMLQLIENEEYATQISDNAIMTLQELFSNESIMRNWHIAYFEIIENFKNNKPFSDGILIK